jgi:hypothetical protein
MNTSAPTYDPVVPFGGSNGSKFGRADRKSGIDKGLDDLDLTTLRKSFSPPVTDTVPQNPDTLTFETGESRENRELHKRLRQAKLKYFLFSLIEGKVWTGVMFFLTIFALFATDVHNLTMPKSQDAILDWLMFMSLIAFMVELIIGSYVKPKYIGRLFFWLDLVATLSIVPDIGFLGEHIDGLMGIEETSDDTSIGNDDGSGVIARAGRAARVGTRAGRVARLVRVLRIVRLFRIAKLYKYTQRGQNM